MSRGYPSMTALLALLAVAGYQNRDKIAEMLGGATAPGKPGEPAKQVEGGGLGGLLGGLGGLGAGGLLSGGLGELVDRFKKSGLGDVADSWVQTGPNKPLSTEQVKQSIGPDVLSNLSKQTGLSENELLARLAKVLPSAVDQYTPQGRLPAEA